MWIRANEGPDMSMAELFQALSDVNAVHDTIEGVVVEHAWLHRLAPDHECALEGIDKPMEWSPGEDGAMVDAFIAYSQTMVRMLNLIHASFEADGWELPEWPERPTLDDQEDE